MMYEGATFEFKGHTFRFNTEHDDMDRCPWEDDCGVGIVSDWTRDAKEPGQRVLNRDHRSYRYYDFARTIQKATADGWGLAPDNLAALERRLGRKPTAKQVVAEAVELDFKRMRGWCNDDWSYIGVIVTHVDEDGNDGESESLWGIESDCQDYVEETAHELADQLMYDIGKEESEASHWANKNLATA